MRSQATVTGIVTYEGIYIKGYLCITEHVQTLDLRMYPLPVPYAKDI